MRSIQNPINLEPQTSETVGSTIKLFILDSTSLQVFIIISKLTGFSIMSVTSLVGCILISIQLGGSTVRADGVELDLPYMHNLGPKTSYRFFLNAETMDIKFDGIRMLTYKMKNERSAL